MEYTTVQAVKYILTTFQDGKTNKLYDSTFRLRPPFKPNSNGQYKVTINECLFQNNEATLVKDKDYLQFVIYDKTGTNICEFTINRNIYTFDKNDQVKAINAVKYSDSATDNYLERGGDPYIKQISIYNTETNNPLTDTFSQNFHISISFTDPTKFADVAKVGLLTSTNYGYLLNDLRASEILGEKDTTKNCFNFYFHNPRLGGPYLYVLKTPLQATVPTYNAINQAYNIVACTYNPNGLHNTNIQMCSSMEVVTNDLSNFRIALVNDQYEPVEINTPIYLQITVSND